jgi:LPS export ABC transporter protein LptC
MRRRQYLILAIAGTALLVSVFVFKRYLPYTGIPATPRQPPEVVMTIEGAYLVGLGRGGKLWSLRADKVEVAQNRSTTILTGISGGNVYDGKDVAFSVQAGRAIYDSLHKSLALSGGLKVRSRKQEIKLDGAVWNPATAILCSTGPVVYKGQWGRLTADRLELNVRTMELDLSRVNGSFDVNNTRGLFQVGPNAASN